MDFILPTLGDSDDSPGIKFHNFDSKKEIYKKENPLY